MTADKGMKVLSSGKHRSSSASAPRTPFNAQGAFFKASLAISRNIKTIKVGAVALSSLLVVAMAGSTAPSFASGSHSISPTSAVSRNHSRAALTTETATVAQVQGSEWALNSSSSTVNIQYSMSEEQTNHRNALISAYESAKNVYGANSSAAASSLTKLSNALNTAATHLQDTTTAASQYDADASAINSAVSEVKASAQASRTTSQSSNASSSTPIVITGSGSGADVANFGLTFVGKVPYVWGGSSTSGWDCSGFVQYVYAHYGVKLPRVSGAQATVGRAVGSLAEAQVGDIIANGMHAGIYIGNGMVVNALNPSQGTKVTPVNVAFTGGYSIRRVF